MASRKTLETDILTYSEMSVPTLDEVRVPETILQYRRRMAENQRCSIFDQDPSINSEPIEPVYKNLDNPFDDDDRVTRVISGRGRGGRNIYKPPGVQSNDDLELIKQIRSVAPLGYGNDLTVQAVRAHQAKKKELNGRGTATPLSHYDDSPLDVSGGPSVQKPPPLSDILKQSKEEQKRKQQEVKTNEDLASKRLIEEILIRDRLEEEERSSSRSTSCGSSRSSRSWTKRSRTGDDVDLNSLNDFPPLK